MSDNKPVEQFVFSVLDQIRSGVAKAQESGQVDGFQVNPGGLVLKDQSGVLSLSQDGFICGKVEFDLSVAVEEAAEASGGLKLTLFGEGLSFGGKVNDKSGTVHKVKFFVPVEYPKLEKDS